MLGMCLTQYPLSPYGGFGGGYGLDLSDPKHLSNLLTT